MIWDKPDETIVLGDLNSFYNGGSGDLQTGH